MQLDIFDFLGYSSDIDVLESENEGKGEKHDHNAWP
jgi:hypothetical protein